MAAIWPSAVATTLQMIQAINNTKVTLNVAAGIGDTTLTVDDASPLPTSGYVTFDDNEALPETIYYTGKSGNNLTGVTRAADSTAAGTHLVGSHLEMRFNAAYHNTLATEVIAVEQNLSDRVGVDSGSHVLLAVNGLVGAPSYSFANSPTTGLYRIGADDIGFANAGVKTIEFNATNQVIIPKTTNQIVLGVTNTVTISATAPSSSRTLTIPDPGGAASFVLTAGTQTIAGATTFTLAIPISATTNQLVLGTTNTTTITAPAPASSRVYTIPDAGGAANLMLDKGNYTLTGTWTNATLVTPTLGVASATSITFGGTALSTYVEGTWTPSDQSGAGLSFTVSVAKYTKIGKVVFIECFLTFPSTASGATNQIGGLPFTVDDESMTMMSSNAALTDIIRFIPGTSNFQIMTAAGRAAATNVALTTDQIIFTGFYFHV